MSRVDEARRRAYELGSGPVDRRYGPRLLAPLPGVDAAVLTPDPFPAEGVASQPRRARAAAAVIAAPAALPDPLPETGVIEPPPLLAPAPRTPLDRRGVPSGRLIIDEDIPPASREQYRLLAASLHKMQAANGTRVVMIASAVIGEGKTLTSANLALTFSESYQRRVLLIDADLRRPSLHLLFGLTNASGLSDSLTAHRRAYPVQTLSPRLSILTAGRPGADPMAELTSDDMKRLVQHARETYDWVVIDTPPIDVLPDASLVAAMADAAVMVIRAGVTPYDSVTRAVEAVGRQKIAGVLLNGATQPHSHSYHRYYDTTGTPSGGRG